MTPADRIAALEAELVEARRERDSARFHIREDQKCLAEANALIDELLPHKPSKCGNAIDGCGKPFDKWHLVYRCLDCDLPMHRECLQRHCEHELQKERAAHARTQAELTEARTSLAILRNAVHGHCATEACTGERGCWCDDCIAERSQKDSDGMLSPWQLPATEKACAGRAIAERVPLWRELESAERTSMLKKSPWVVDVLRKLAALDEKGGA